MPKQVDKAIIALVKRYESDPDAYIESDDYEYICEYYIRMAQLEKAIAAAKQGLALHPNHTPFYLHLSKAYFEMNNLALATEYIQSAVQRYKSCDEQNEHQMPRTFYDYLYDALLLQIEIYIRQNNMAGATQCIKEAEKLKTTHAYSMHYDFGLLFMNYDLPQRALTYCLKACRSYPNDKESWGLLSHVYLLLGNTNKAIKALEHLIDIDPYSVNAWSKLGAIHCDVQQYVEAEKAFRYALSIDDKHAETWYYYATLYLCTAAYEKAIEYFLICQQLGYNELKTDLNIAICERKLGNTNASIERLAQLFKQYPHLADVKMEYGYALLEGKQHTMAISIFEQIHEPGFVIEAWKSLSRLYFETNQLATAIEYAHKVNNIESTPAWNIWLGYLYVQNDELERGLALFLAAKETDATFPTLDLNIALTYQLMGNQTEQNRYFQLALENDPETFTQFMQDNNDFFKNNNHLFNNESAS